MRTFCLALCALSALLSAMAAEPKAAPDLPGGKS
jgi:hypothetical protein